MPIFHQLQHTEVRFNHKGHVHQIEFVSVVFILIYLITIPSLFIRGYYAEINICFDVLQFVVFKQQAVSNCITEDVYLERRYSHWKLFIILWTGAAQSYTKRETFVLLLQY